MAKIPKQKISEIKNMKDDEKSKKIAHSPISPYDSGYLQYKAGLRGLRKINEYAEPIEKSKEINNTKSPSPDEKISTKDYFAYTDFPPDPIEIVYEPKLNGPIIKKDWGKLVGSSQGPNEQIESVDESESDNGLDECFPQASVVINLINCGFCNHQIDIRKDQHSNYNNFGRKQFSVSCVACASKLIQCAGCSKNFDDTKYLQEKYCSNCIENAPTNKKFIRAYADKSESHFEPELTKRKENFKFHGENSKAAFADNDIRSLCVGSHGIYAKYLGVELEYETLKNYGLGVISVYNIIKESGLKAIMKRDGTLKKGFEVVSAPCDKSYHYSAWDTFFNKIENDPNIFCAPYEPPVPPQERGTGCGCHIHISKDFLSHVENYGKSVTNGYGLACLKLQTFVHHPKNRKFIELIAGRESNMFSDFTCVKGLRFDKKNRIVGGASDIIKSKFDHRTAINFHSSNNKTIEFRIFRSTKNKEEFLKNIDFVDAICAFCRTGVSSIEEIKDWIYFYEFVCKNRQDYLYLYHYLDRSIEFSKLYNEKNS